MILHDDLDGDNGVWRNRMWRLRDFDMEFGKGHRKALQNRMGKWDVGTATDPLIIKLREGQN